MSVNEFDIILPKSKFQMTSDEYTPAIKSKKKECRNLKDAIYFSMNDSYYFTSEGDVSDPEEFEDKIWTLVIIFGSVFFGMLTAVCLSLLIL